MARNSLRTVIVNYVARLNVLVKENAKKKAKASRRNIGYATIAGRLMKSDIRDKDFVRGVAAKHISEVLLLPPIAIKAA